MFDFLRLILFLLFLLLPVSAVRVDAQDMGPVQRNTYFLAADASGVQQIFQVMIGSSDAPRQVSSASIDVLTFGVSSDGLSLVYISGGLLWLQPVHTESAEILASIDTTQSFSSPIYSSDDEYIAYASDGVWLLDLSTRQTRQILQDVRMEDLDSSTAEFRIYNPARFVRGSDGRPQKLVVHVGVWEWLTTGIYDLETGDLQLLEGQVNNYALPIYGDKVLLYGNGGMAGEFGLHLAESLEDINSYRKVLDFSDLTNESLFAEQAVEIAPGKVRVFGSVMDVLRRVFYVDVDLMAGTSSELTFITLSNNQRNNVLTGRLSPDGALLPVYHYAGWSEAGDAYGEFQMLDLATGLPLESLSYPQKIGLLRWQP